MLSDKDTAQQVRDDAPRKAVEPNQTPVRAAQAAGTTQRKQEAIVGEDFKAKQQTPMQEAADKEAGVSRPEKSVAGRKTMKGVESKDGKEAPLYPKGDEAEGTQVTKETEEDHKVEAELNSILKKGSSKLGFCFGYHKPRRALALIRCFQSSYSANPIAPSPLKRNTYSSRNTP